MCFIDYSKAFDCVWPYPDVEDPEEDECVRTFDHLNKELVHPTRGYNEDRLWKNRLVSN